MLTASSINLSHYVISSLRSDFAITGLGSLNQFLIIIVSHTFHHFAHYINYVKFVSSCSVHYFFIFYYGSNTIYLLLYVNDIMLMVSSIDLLHYIISSLRL